jgi:hypothetical protein
VSGDIQDEKRQDAFVAQVADLYNLYVLLGAVTDCVRGRFYGKWRPGGEHSLRGCESYLAVVRGVSVDRQRESSVPWLLHARQLLCAG